MWFLGTWGGAAAPANFGSACGLARSNGQENIMPGHVPPSTARQQAKGIIDIVLSRLDAMAAPSTARDAMAEAAKNAVSKYRIRKCTNLHGKVACNRL
jgi:hypothetical protein